MVEWNKERLPIVAAVAQRVGYGKEADYCGAAKVAGVVIFGAVLGARAEIILLCILKGRKKGWERFRLARLRRELQVAGLIGYPDSAAFF